MTLGPGGMTEHAPRTLSEAIKANLEYFICFSLR